MLEVVRAEPRHIVDLDVQPRHADAKATITAAVDSVPLDNAFTLLRDGVPVAVGGIHAGLGWALLGRDLKRGEMVVVHRVASRLLSTYTAPVVAEIDESHFEAVRWAKLLGMVKVLEGQRCAWYASIR